MRAKAIQGLVIGLAAGALAGLAMSFGLLARLEGVTWDYRVRIAARREQADPRVRLVFIDQASLDWGAARGFGWPWPRQVYAPLLAFMRRAGARAVVFDLLFTEQSQWGVEDDRAFGQAIAATPGFVGAIFLGRESGSVSNWPAGAPEPCVVEGLTDLPDQARQDLSLTRAAFPIPDVATNATLLGNVWGETDADAIVRSTPPFRVFDARVVPSLGLAAYLAAHPAENVALRPGRLTIGDREVPLDRAGRAILRYRGASQSHPVVNAAAVIDSEQNLLGGGVASVDPEPFRDTYVFVGVTAPGLMDLRPTPLTPLYPGVEIHATFLDNLLGGDFMRDTPAWLDALVALLLAIGAGLWGRHARGAPHSALAFVFCLAAPFLLGLGAYRLGYWLAVTPSAAAVLLALVGALIVNYALEGRQKRYIKSAFRQYLSPAVIERLLDHPDRLKLGGELRELTLFFSDVEGFTSISERLGPEALTSLLNTYLTAMTDIIMEEGGTIDKYEGDAIIAFWNAPLDQADHSERGVRAALRCQEKLAELRPALAARAGRELRARIGVNTGPVVVGNMGSHQRFNYTFLGDAGNLASRLEGINKQFGTFLLVSESTRRRLGEVFAFREISRVRVVGRAEPVRVFEPARREDAWPAGLTRGFTEALEAYYKGDFQAAAAKFEALAPSDPPSAAYAARCRILAQKPPDAWDGVWTMTEK